VTRDKALTAPKMILKSFGDPREMQKYAADPDGMKGQRETYDKRGILKKAIDKSMATAGLREDKPQMRSCLKKPFLFSIIIDSVKGKK
jgi:hypothetical protein